MASKTLMYAIVIIVVLIIIAIIAIVPFGALRLLVQGEGGGTGYGYGTISASSTPSGAYVYVDNVYKGTTFVNITGVREGNHQVKFSKPGYQNVTQTVLVNADERVYAYAVLPPI